MMAYGKDMPETPHGPKILHKIRREPQMPENMDLVNDCKLYHTDDRIIPNYLERVYIMKFASSNIISHLCDE